MKITEITFHFHSYYHLELHCSWINLHAWSKHIIIIEPRVHIISRERVWVSNSLCMLQTHCVNTKSTPPGVNYISSPISKCLYILFACVIVYSMLITSMMWPTSIGQLNCWPSVHFAFNSWSLLSLLRQSSFAANSHFDISAGILPCHVWEQFMRLMPIQLQHTDSHDHVIITI